MADGWTWDIDPPVRRVFLTLPDAAQTALYALMDEITGDDPRGIREMAAAMDPGGHMERLPFGGDGLVSILIVVRATHVQVIQITWLGP
jgi:hypothetical protein